MDLSAEQRDIGVDLMKFLPMNWIQCVYTKHTLNARSYLFYSAIKQNKYLTHQLRSFSLITYESDLVCIW